MDLLERAAELVKHLPRTGKCVICDTTLETQKHHILPKHLGGPDDGPLIDICSAHHLMIHHISTKNPIPPGFTPKQIKIIRVLVRFITLAKIEYDNANSADKTWIDRKIIVTVPDALLKRAHKRKLDCGHTNLADYILELITRDTSIL
jgi:hypothetical protein